MRQVTRFLKYKNVHEFALLFEEIALFVAFRALKISQKESQYIKYLHQDFQLWILHDRYIHSN